MDTITIDSLHIKTIIGVNDDEKVTPQDLYLTVAMGVDIQASLTSDDLNDTVDYDSLSKSLIDFIEQSRYELIEALSHDCVKLIFDFSDIIKQVDFTVSKPNAIPNAITTMFSMSRHR